MVLLIDWEKIGSLDRVWKSFGKVVNMKCNVGANRNQAFIEFVSARHYPSHFHLVKIVVNCSGILLCFISLNLLQAELN